MATGQQPQSYVPAGPTGAEIGRQLMAQFAQNPNSLAAILSGINQITRPTMGLPQAQSSLIAAVLMNTPATNATGSAPQVTGAPRQAAAAPIVPGAGTPAGSSASPGLSPSSVGSLLKDAGKLYQTLSAPGAMGVPSVLSGPLQSALQSAFTSPAVANSVADAMGLTAGPLAPLAASQLAPVGTGAVAPAAESAFQSATAALDGAPAASAAPAAASAPAATGAGSTSLGALAADAGALAAAGYAAHGAMTMPTNNGWGIGQISQLGKNVQNATNAGLLSPTQTTAGSINPMNANGTINQPLMSALQSLNQLQLGNFGLAGGYAQNLLNGMGYQTLAQSAGPNYQSTRGGAPTSVAANLLRKRY